MNNNGHKSLENINHLISNLAKNIRINPNNNYNGNNANTQNKIGNGQNNDIQIRNKSYKNFEKISIIMQKILII